MLKRIRCREGRGFTLLELIVVIVILGILAGLAVPSFRSISQKSVEQVAVSNAQTIVRAATIAAAAEGDSLSDEYIDAAGAAIEGYVVDGNTLTVSKAGSTTVVTINPTTGALSVSSSSGESSNEPSYTGVTIDPAAVARDWYGYNLGGSGPAVRSVSYNSAAESITFTLDFVPSATQSNSFDVFAYGPQAANGRSQTGGQIIFMTGETSSNGVTATTTGGVTTVTVPLTTLQTFYQPTPTTSMVGWYFLVYDYKDAATTGSPVNAMHAFQVVSIP